MFSVKPSVLSVTEFARAYTDKGFPASSMYQHAKSTKWTLDASWTAASDSSSEPQFKLEYFNGKKVVAVPIKFKPTEQHMLESEIKAMVRAITTRAATNLATAIDGKNSVAICVATEKSARLNRIVPIK